MYNGKYMHHKKKHTAKFSSHNFTIKMFTVMFSHMLSKGLGIWDMAQHQFQGTPAL